MTTTYAAARLPVVVVDDHHHVLSDIHLAIRRRVLPFDRLHVLHFDAHPDLSFPRSLDASVVFQPEMLYNSLDESVSGIAEFLLPLVYAGHVSQITWIKSPWAHQIASSANTDLSIGTKKGSNCLCVSLPVPHFIEEDAYAPAEALEPETIRNWDFFVAELPECQAMETGHASYALREAQQNTRAYVLDVDLDYFSTWNPFRRDLEERCGAAVAQVVAQVFIQLQHKDQRLEMTTDTRIHARRTFASVMEQIQERALYLDPSSSACRQALAAVVPLYQSRVDAESALLEFLRILADADESTRELIWWAGPNMDLPHHHSSDQEITSMISAMKAFFLAHELDKRPPALVTVAKSIGDHYLPPVQVEFVLSSLLRMLEQLFGALDVSHVEYDKEEEDSNMQ